MLNYMHNLSGRLQQVIFSTAQFYTKSQSIIIFDEIEIPFLIPSQHISLMPDMCLCTRVSGTFVHT